MVINPTALTQEATDSDSPMVDSESATDEAIAERAGVELRGLHAKLYVADNRSRSRL
jgi:hypothetical protein